MNTSTFKRHLKASPEAELAFVLPNGRFIPAHAHVTEVGRVEKRFIDCGGTHRSWITTNLQTWVDADVDHRFPAGKLARILDLAAPLFGEEDPEVEIEHEDGLLSQYPVETVTHDEAGRLVFQLTAKHADCLAKDVCLPAAAESESACCGDTCCC